MFFMSSSKPSSVSLGSSKGFALLKLSSSSEDRITTTLLLDDFMGVGFGAGAAVGVGPLLEATV